MNYYVRKRLRLEADDNLGQRSERGRSGFPYGRAVFKQASTQAWY